MVEFPTHLVLLFDGFSFSTRPNIIKSEFESGDQKTRPRNCKSMFEYKCTYQLCSENYDDFFDFYCNAIGNGSCYFLWLEPNSGKKIKAKIKEGSIQVQPDAECLSTYRLSLSIEAYK